MNNNVVLQEEIMLAEITLAKYQKWVNTLEAQGYWGTPRYVQASELASNTEDHIEYLQTQLDSLACAVCTRKSNTSKSNEVTTMSTSNTMNIHNNVADTPNSPKLNELWYQLGMHEDLVKQAQNAVDSFEYNPSDAEYDAWLDEIHAPVTIGYSTWDASAIIKEMSPTDYRIGRTDFIDSVDIEDLDEYKELVHALQDADAELESIQEQIDELESAQ